MRIAVARAARLFGAGQLAGAPANSQNRPQADVVGGRLSGGSMHLDPSRCMHPHEGPQGRRHAGRWRRSAPSETVNHHSIDVSSACKPSVGSPVLGTGRIDERRLHPAAADRHIDAGAAFGGRAGRGARLTTPVTLRRRSWSGLSRFRSGGRGRIRRWHRAGNAAPATCTDTVFTKTTGAFARPARYDKRAKHPLRVSEARMWRLAADRQRAPKCNRRRAPPADRTMSLRRSFAANAAMHSKPAPYSRWRPQQATHPPT